MSNVDRKVEHYEEISVTYTEEEVIKIIEEYTRAKCFAPEGEISVDLSLLKISLIYHGHDPKVHVKIRKQLP